MIRETTPDKLVRVLIVDDEEDDFILTKAHIGDIPSRQFAIEWCPNYKKALDRIRKAEHDIYFVDYRLGVKTGLDLLRELSTEAHEDPIILLTGLGNEDIDLEAMRLGAADYLIKSELNPEKLDRCIRYSLERASTLKASRANERKYRNIFEKTRDVIFIADSNLVISNINEASAELLGTDRRTLLGVSLYDHMPEVGERSLLAAALKDKGSIEDFQITLFTENESIRMALISASSETDSQGQAYVQGIIHDITLFKRTEEIRLQTEKLEAKGEVIRTLAHEIRNPLNNISVSIDQMKSTMNGEGVELMNIVRRGVKRIDSLISKLMDSAQYLKMNFVALPLQTVISQALDGANDRIALKKITLELSLPQRPAVALVDQEKVKTAILNILINAIEAMEMDKGVLQVSIQSKPRVHEVIIRDNGCGMSKETLDHLFEPYFTAKPSGVGIGLSSTLAIIEAHKATITLQSAVEKGTEFTISFPAA
jgi:PAS domain S-box-containing protein